MGLIAAAAVLYSLFDFVENIYAMDLDIHTIFKPIIATTLGLAIFDLAKTILEQEVFYKSYVKDSKETVKLLTKFLFTILIALAIETLMVVFKIAMKENGEMINALVITSYSIHYTKLYETLCLFGITACQGTLGHILIKSVCCNIE